MTVYVDDVYLQADVPGVRSNARWCHLMSDSHKELMAMAQVVGLHPAWLQHPGQRNREHFNVTKTVRVKCVAAGAKEIDWRDMGDLLAQLRRVDQHAKDDMRTKLHQCSDCGDVRILSGPWCDAANDELWLCNTCILQSEQA